MIDSLGWTIFEIIINIFENLLIVDTLSRCFAHKTTGRRYYFTFWLFFGILFTTITVINIIQQFDQYLIFLALFISLIYCRINLLGKVRDHVVYCILIVLGMVLTSNFALIIVSGLFSLPAEELIYNASFSRMTFVMIAKLLLFSFTRLLCQIRKKRWNNLSFQELIPAVIIPTFSIAILVFIMDALSFVPASENLFSFIALAAVAIINVLVYYLIGKLNHQHDLELQLVRLRQNETLYLQEIKSAKELFDQANKTQHDLKNFSIGLKNLLQQGKINESFGMIDQINVEICKVHTFVHTSNDFVDAIINSKLSEARQKQIEIKCRCQYEIGKIEELDLGRILGNLLDNVMEYFSSHPGTEKTLELTVANKKNYLIIQLENPIEESVIKDNPELHTTKHDGNIHGLGLSSVRDIAKKYDGIVDFHEEDRAFIAVVMLNYLSD